MDKNKIDLINDIVWYIPFKKLRKRIRELLIAYYNNSDINRKLDEIKLKLDNNFIINNTARSLHLEAFKDFKNKHEGKDIVLLATGPTLKNFIPIENAIYVGVNSAIYYDKVKLDYFFLQDCKLGTKNIPKYIIDNKIYETCTCFFGLSNHVYFKDLVSEQERILIKNSKRYMLNTEKTYNHLVYDIISNPLTDFFSVVFSALQFIFWTNPKRIYLVGCDVTTSGHYNDNGKPNMLHLGVQTGWQKVKEFRDIFYPNTEIISVNPVGLNDKFNDIYSIDGKYADKLDLDYYKKYFEIPEYQQSFLKENSEERIDANREDMFPKSRREFYIDRYLFASKYVKDKIVIDSASGTGYGANILYNVGKAKKVYGVEINNKAVAYSQFKYGNENIIYKQGNILELPFENEIFDVFTSFETIEYIKEDEKQMQEVKRVLKNGGYYILSAPNNLGFIKFHVKDYNYLSIKELISKYFKIEKIYNQNSDNTTTESKIIETIESNYEEAKFFIIVAKKEN